MATIELPTARQVYERVGEAPAAFFGLREAAEVYSLINRLGLIDSAAAVAELAADGAAGSVDFPLTLDLIQDRHPALSDAEAQERFERQGKPFTKYILDKAAADLCTSLRPKPESVQGDPNESKRVALNQSAKEALDTGVAYVGMLLTYSNAQAAPTAISFSTAPYYDDDDATAELPTAGTAYYPRPFGI